MGRYKEAPWGFECPDQNAYPHLGMSTTWASLEIRDARKQQSALGLQNYRTEQYAKAPEEDNKKLEAENAELKARLKQQHRLKFKTNKKVPDHPRDPAPRKRGAPQGHPGWHRAEPERVDRSVHVDAPDTCLHCRHEGLEPVDKTHVQIQEDIVLQPRTVVTEYIHQKAFCPICRREVFDTADGELRNCSIGPVTKATAVYAGYNIINPLGRQACLAHIKRKADEIAGRIKMLPKKNLRKLNY